MAFLDGIGHFEAMDARDRQNWDQLSRLLATHADPFGRDPVPGHVTGSAFVLSPDRQAVVLTHHAKLDMWLQLGGHCDGIADAGFVALKEAYEESGLSRIRPIGDPARVLDVDIQTIPANAKEPQHLHFDVRFLFQAEAGRLQASAESHALDWVTLEDLHHRTQTPSVLLLRDKTRQVLAA